jgi:hypothetical protein
VVCRRSLLAVLLVGPVFGCASTATEEKWAPVAGTVKVEGQPLTKGWLTFYPDDAKGNGSTRLPVAEITSNGSYELTTNGKPGAPCGFYKVVVAASKDPIPLKPPRNPDGSPKGLRWLVHDKYTRPETTDILSEVIEEPAAGRYDFDLSR